MQEKSSQNATLILDRLKFAFNIKTDSELATFLGVARNTISTWRTRDTLDYHLLFAKCEQINLNWLITGEGETFKSVGPPTENIFQTKTTENAYNLNVGENVGLNAGKRKLQKTPTITPASGIASDVAATYEVGGGKASDQPAGAQEIERADQSVQRIPMYDVSMFLNLSKLFAGEYPTTSYICLPNLPKCDGATLMPGDSMEPEIKRGDVIVYKRIRNKDKGLFLGQIYLLSCDMGGEVYVTVRYVLKSENEGHVQLVSANKHYPPQDVPLNAIKELAVIKASVRYNTMI